jgi:hypothetical protein
MAILVPGPKFQNFDSNGDPLVGGRLYTYAAGTTTSQATYTDSTGSAANTNPIILDARGEANVWIDPGLSYKYVLKDANDVTIWTVDNIRDINESVASWCGTAGGSANALVLTPNIVATSYFAGQTFRFLASAANTGATTVDVSGLGAKNIQFYGTALTADCIGAGDMIVIVYDGAQFQMTGALVALPFAIRKQIGNAVTGVTVTAVSTTMFTLNLGSVVAGDIVLFHGQFGGTKGGTAGTVGWDIQKTAGTATMVFNNNFTYLANLNPALPAAAIAGGPIGGFGRITGSGTCTVTFSADSAGSNVTSAFADCWAIVFRGT